MLPKHTRSGWMAPAAALLLPLVAMPLAHHAAVAPWGSGIFLWLLFLLAIPLLACGSLLLIAPLLACFSKTRRTGLVLLLCGVGFLLGFYSGVRLGKQVRMYAFKQLAVRSQPLVDAIHAYCRREGHPPADLESLVPDFIAEVPGTGMGAYPHFEYSTGGKGWYPENPWFLRVLTPLAGLNWDEFTYLPLQDYPKGRGRWQRIGDWAYLHE